MGAAKQQLAELSDRTKSAYEPKIKATQIGFAFDVAAAKVRGGRMPSMGEMMREKMVGKLPDETVFETQEEMLARYQQSL